MNTTNGSCPCKNCEKRSEHCHSKCEEYKAYKNERERLKKKRWLDGLAPYGGYSTNGKKKKSNTRCRSHYIDDDY